MKNLTRLFVALLFCAVLVKADKLTIDNGSVLTGEITAIADGKVTIKTDFAGLLQISADRIQALESDSQFCYADLQDEKHLDTTLSADKLADVKVAWLSGSEDPTLPKGRTWSGESTLDLDGKTGNSEKCRIALGVRATMQGPDDKLLLYANYAKAHENGTTNEDEILGGADYEYLIAGSNNSVYGKFEAEKDKIAMIDLRTQYSAGYGYYFIKRPDMSLRLRLGLNYQKKEYTHSDDTDEAFGAEAGLHFEKDIDAWGKLVTDLTYAPAWNDFDNYRIYHETSLDIPMLTNLPMTLRLGVSNEYNNIVPPLAEHLDTTYFVKLVYRWK